MMREMRENTKFVMIFVAVAFVGLMVFEWGMDISGRNTAAQTGELGRVDGRPIPYAAYTAAYQQMYDRALQQNPDLSPEEIRQLEEAAFNQVVAEILLDQEIARRGIRVTEEEIRQAAQWNPHPELMQQEIFQTNGRFDLSKWQQFLGSPAANDQLLLQLESYYRDMLPREKLMRQVTAGLMMSDAELWRLWRDQNETASADYVRLNLATLVPGDVQVTEAEVKEYYEENEEEFERPATARLKVAVLSKATVAADTTAALQRAREVRAQIVGGADFEEVARRVSADPGSRERGGMLGTFGRGAMVPAFEEAAFSLPVGQLSEPVETPFGFHLIEVTAREGDQVTARHILIPIEPSEEAVDALYARADSLEDLSARVGLQRAARATKAAVRQGIVVNEDQPFVPGIGSMLEAVDWAIDESAAEEAETVSPLFETPMAFYLVELEALTPAGQVPLREVAPEIRRQLILKKKTERARQIGQEIVAEVRQGKTLQAAAQERGLQVERTGPFGRLQPNPVFGQATAAVGAAFGTPIGQVSNVVETPAGLFIVRPVERTEADRAEFEQQKEQLRQAMLFQAQQQQIGRFLESLRERAEIVDWRDEVLRAS